MKSREHALEDVFQIVTFLALIRQRDVAGEVSKHDTPRGGIGPHISPEYDVLPLVRHPQPGDLERPRILARRWRRRHLILGIAHPLARGPGSCIHYGGRMPHFTFKR